MGGVFGVVGFVGGGVGVGGVLDVMGGAAGYRGPDGVGVWSDGGVGLGCLECWVSPESVGVKGPWVGEDVVVAGDVRLDNRADLVRGLDVEAGVSDRELLGLAYRRWGDRCVERLMGDFAFVVYDRRRRRVFAARDAMGMRPLYYRSEPGRFLFASEVKQILAVPGVPARIFEPAVAGYLASGMTKLEWTFYEGISQLPPAHSLTATENKVDISRYWDIDPEHQIRYQNQDDYADHFRELFVEAVRARTRTDYPVGIFLSGGVDSGSIASTIGWLQQQGEGPDNFHAYNWAFDQLPQCDERHLSRLITDHYQIPTTDISADNAYPLAEYPDHGPHPDEPFIGVYQPLIDHTLQTAQTHNTKLMLSGDRGDLVAGGFVIDYVDTLVSGQFGGLLREMRIHHEVLNEGYFKILRNDLAKPVLQRLKLRSPGEWGRWLRERLHRHGDPRELKIPEWSMMEVSSSLLPARNWILDSFPQPAQSKRYEWVFLPFHMRGMTWSNRTYARYGQAFADPWSDRRIAEYVLAIPQQVLNRPRTLRKGLVRDALQGLMPDEFRQRAKKIVPQPLYDLSLRRLGVEVVAQILSDPVVAPREWLDVSSLRTAYRRFLDNETSLPHEFWWALTVEMWVQALDPTVDLSPHSW